MRRRNPVVLTLFLVLAFVAGVELYFVYDQILQLSESWYLLLFVFLAMLCLALRPDHYAVPVLSMLLVSVSVLLSFIVPEDILIWGGWRGRLGYFLWLSLWWLSPFLFIHFALLFPVYNRWFEKRHYRFALLYVPYGMILLSGQFEILLVFPLGFMIGLVIFIHQYSVSLTTAERNRLKLILIGCLAGLAPLILFQLGSEQFPKLAWYLSNGLLPVFPACLAIAVLKENFSEVGRGFRRFMVYSLVAGGLVPSTLLAYLLLSLLLPEVFDPNWYTLVSVVFFVALAYPLSRWASKYVSHRFRSAPGLKRGTMEALPDFRPIRPNPFIVGNPVRTPDMFFGRREEFSFIRSIIRNQRQGSVIVLTGERRTGKSSILYQILNGSLGEEYLAVFLDMQGLVVDSDVEFLNAIADRIAELVPDEQSTRYDTYLGLKTPHIAFTSFVDAAIERIGDHHLVLLFDEYELIEDRINAGRLSREIPTYLNSILERKPRLSMIFTGSRPVEAKTLWNSLLGKSTYREISFLHWKDAEALLRYPLQRRAVFEDQVVRELLRLTNGHPFFTQLLGQTVVDLLNEKQSTLVDAQILHEGVHRVIEHPPPQLLYQWAGLSRPEKLVLASLATLLKNPGEYASSAGVSRVLQSIPEEDRHQVDLIQTRICLEGLRREKILDRDQSRYRFTMDLIRRWVRAEHSVWGILSESSSRSP